MTEEEQQQEDENKRIRPQERARGQKNIGMQKHEGKVRKVRLRVN